MGLAYSILNGHFGPVYLLQVSQNDDEEHCFLKSNLDLTMFMSNTGHQLSSAENTCYSNRPQFDPVQHSSILLKTFRNKTIHTPLITNGCL